MRPLLARFDADPRLAARVALAICALVAVARVVIALVTPSPALVLDAAGYDIAARRLVDHGYFAYTHPEAVVTSPPANAAVLPGLPVWIAGVYKLTGATTAQPAMSVVQAVLGAVALWGIFLLASAVAKPSTGVIATVLGTAYLPFWWSYRYVLTEDLFLALSVYAVWLFVEAMRSEGTRLRVLFALSGLVSAAALYTRAAIAVWIVAAGTIAFLSADPARRRALLGGGAIMALTIVLCFTPWWVRNARLYDAFVPLNTLTATGSWLSTFGPDDPDRWVQLSTVHVDFDVPRSDLDANRRIEAMTNARVRQLLAHDPLMLVRLHARSTAISIGTYHPNPYGNFRGIAGLAEAYHLALLALAAAGLWLGRRRAAVWVVAAYPITHVAAYATTLAFSRYLFPMMPFVIVLAAYAVGSAARRSADSPTQSGMAEATTMAGIAG